MSIPSQATAVCIADLQKAYRQPILDGDRNACRAIIEEALTGGTSAMCLLNEVIWPTMEWLQALYRQDRINQMTLNLATRLNRYLADQIASRLDRLAAHGKSVLIFCGNDEPEELGGQITAEMFEANGWTVKFAGGGVPDDEVLKLIGEMRPDLLLMFGTLPSGVPAVRKLIDYFKEVNSCPNMQIMCCGGIYKRAEGLAEEIGADLYAPDAAGAVEVAAQNPTRRATVDQQTVGRTRRIRKAAARRAMAASSASDDQGTDAGDNENQQME